MRSGVERGAERNVHERDTQSCGEVFFGPVSVKVGFDKFQFLNSKVDPCLKLSSERKAKLN